MKFLSNSRAQRLFGEASWIGAGQIASVLGTLMLVRILTEYLSPAKYGQLALGLTIATLMNQVVTGGICNGIGRFYSIASEAGDLKGYFAASKRILLWATLAVVIIGVALEVGLVSCHYATWLGLATACTVFALFSGYNASLSAIQNAARQRAIVAFHGGLDAWLRVLFAYLAIRALSGSNVAVVVIAYTMSLVLVNCSQLLFLRRLLGKQKSNNETKNSKDWMRQMWSYSWPFCTWGVFLWGQQSAPRWALEHFATTSEVGYFAVLSQLGYTPIQTVTTLALVFIMPILFAKAGDASQIERREDVRKLTHKLVILGVLITGVLFLLTSIFHVLIFHLFAGKQYLKVSHYLPIMVLAGGVFSIAQVYSSRLMALMVPRAMIPAYIGSSIIGIIVAYAGAYFFALQGAVVALFIHAIIYFLWILMTVNICSKNTQ